MLLSTSYWVYSRWGTPPIVMHFVISSVPLGKYWGSTSIKTRPLPSKICLDSSFVNHPTFAVSLNNNKICRARIISSLVERLIFPFIIRYHLIMRSYLLSTIHYGSEDMSSLVSDVEGYVDTCSTHTPSKNSDTHRGNLHSVRLATRDMTYPDSWSGRTLVWVTERAAK
jgi:hypothetical protein